MLRGDEENDFVGELIMRTLEDFDSLFWLKAKGEVPIPGTVSSLWAEVAREIFATPERVKNVRSNSSEGLRLGQATGACKRFILL